MKTVWVTWACFEQDSIPDAIEYEMTPDRCGIAPA
jgi:hypothetical protein